MVQGVVEQSALAEADVHDGATLGISSRGGGILAGDDDVGALFLVRAAPGCSSSTATSFVSDLITPTGSPAVTRFSPCAGRRHAGTRRGGRRCPPCRRAALRSSPPRRSRRTRAGCRDRTYGSHCDTQKFHTHSRAGSVRSSCTLHQGVADLIPAFCSGSRCCLLRSTLARAHGLVLHLQQRCTRAEAANAGSWRCASQLGVQTAL